MPTYIELRLTVCLSTCLSVNMYYHKFGAFILKTYINLQLGINVQLMIA